MRGIPWKLLAAGCITAILLDLPFPLAGPLPVWRTVFAWFALVPLLTQLMRLPAATGRSLAWQSRWAFFAGWLCGALWFGLNCYWVYDTMHLYGGMNPPMAALSLVLFSLFLGFWFGLFALVLTLLRRASIRSRFSWIGWAGIPFLWVAMEFAIARIPSFPWDELGYSQVDNALLMRLVPWTGVAGISFLLAAVNAMLALGLAAIARRERANRHGAYFSFPTYFGSLGLALAGVGCAGFLVRPPRPAQHATAVLVQPNLDVLSDDVWVGQEWDRHIAQFEQLGHESCKRYLNGIPETGAVLVVPECPMLKEPPGLLVWPESPAPFRDADSRFQSAMMTIATADKTPIIVGAIGMEDDPANHRYRIYNSAVVIDKGGYSIGRYDKIHLVPFGEYVPARDLLFFVRQITQTLTDMSRGRQRKVFAIAGHSYGIFLCYESVFGDEVRQFAQSGAEVLVNISDDGWYGDTSAPWQHLNMARMRAIENRRWILRDTNSGVTAAIDPYGTVRQSIPRHMVEALPAQFGYASELTFYTAHGDLLDIVCTILSLALTIWALTSLMYQQRAFGKINQLG